MKSRTQKRHRCRCERCQRGRTHKHERARRDFRMHHATDHDPIDPYGDISDLRDERSGK